jgi:hypothetical protein
MITPTRAGAGSATKVAAFVAVLAVVFGGAWVAGAQAGPIGSTPAIDDAASHGMATHKATGEESAKTDGDVSSGSEALPGLASSRDGYRLQLTRTTSEPGTHDVAFTIVGPDGRPVTAFDVEHEKELHLILVRRDQAGFQHLHPVLDEATGTWTVRARLMPGSWRIFTDFTATGGPALVLGTDLLVPGRVPVPQAVDETRTDRVDGYTVTLDGTLRAGTHSALTLRVSKDGAPVTDLQPYLGAYGHLVALREGDLAYLHVHPGGQPGDGHTQPGPGIDFGAEVPSAGRYHLYLDFQHHDVVRTAHFVLDAAPATGSSPGDGPDGHDDTDHTH